MCQRGQDWEHPEMPELEEPRRSLCSKCENQPRVLPCCTVNAWQRWSLKPDCLLSDLVSQTEEERCSEGVKLSKSPSWSPALPPYLLFEISREFCGLALCSIAVCAHH